MLNEPIEQQGPRTEQRDDGVLYAVAGASRHGKTAWVKQQITGAQRVLVRDPRMEYLDMHCIAVNSISELARRIKACGKGPGKFAYTGPDAGFNDWARLAYLWCQLWPAVIVAEEISDVTNPGKAPPGWGELIRKGLYYGAHIYSITQRPVECDKTVWGNASVIHTHGFVRMEDSEYMARQLGCDVAMVDQLPPLAYLEKRIGEREIERGEVRFAGSASL